MTFESLGKQLSTQIGNLPNFKAPLKPVPPSPQHKCQTALPSLADKLVLRVFIRGIALQALRKPPKPPSVQSAIPPCPRFPSAPWGGRAGVPGKASWLRPLPRARCSAEPGPSAAPRGFHPRANVHPQTSTFTGRWSQSWHNMSLEHDDGWQMGANWLVIHWRPSSTPPPPAKKASFGTPAHVFN